MKVLKNKIAVVTGASQGIGRAISISLSKEGCTLALIARGKEGLDKVANEILAFGGKVEVFPCDVSDFKKVAEILKNIETQFGQIDILVNNAGLGTFKPLDITSFEETIQPVMLPFGSAMVACQTVIKGMINRKSGHIVNLTSPAGYFPLPNMVPYTAARYAIVGMSLALYEELHDKGIGVSLLCPGHVNTGYFERNDASMDWYPKIAKMFPTIEPEVVGAKAVYAIKNDKREVIFPTILWFIVRYFQTFPASSLWFLKFTGLFKSSK
ncbi:MAG: SDR family NAD(P)-dependent oxidoreductase [Leptospiraceae bacterium]|mgnify:FL=1|nr:SDR family NAD(P)-dependent oxidoreductase [Leptospiraceae bacterium]